MTGDEVCWVELVAGEDGKHRVHLSPDCTSLEPTFNTNSIELTKYSSRNNAAIAYGGQVFDCLRCKFNL